MILVVFHPESPGVRIPVRRSWVGRLFKPRDFATSYEVLAYYRAAELIRALL